MTAVTFDAKEKKMSNFVIWHSLAICTVIGSFLIGYSTAKQQEKKKEQTMDKSARKELVKRNITPKQDTEVDAWLHLVAWVQWITLVTASIDIDNGNPNILCKIQT